MDHFVGPDWWQTWIAGYMRAQRRRNRAVNSLRSWATYLRDLGTFLEAEGIDMPEKLVREHLYRWQDSLRVRLLASSQQTAVGAVRGLLKWADREELSPRPGLWSWLDTPRRPEALPRALEPAELAAVLEHYIRPTRDFNRLRDRALFWFLVTTGARISEALQVDVDQFEGRMGRMVVRKKGGDQHQLVMSERARQWVADYLRARGRDREPALWIHAGPRGRRRLRGAQANRIWVALARELELRPFTSHALRHTGVTELGEHDATDDDVVQHVGWKSSNMLSRYRQLRNRRHQELVDRLDDLMPQPPPAPEPRRGRRFRVVDGKRPA